MGIEMLSKRGGVPKIQGSETDFKIAFRDTLAGWSEAYEPGRGSGTGYPDLQVLVNGRLIPVEAKVGVFSRGKLWCREVRPAQIGWHYRLMRAGGFSVFIFGVLDASIWNAYVFQVRLDNFGALKAWRDGIDTKHLIAWNARRTDNVRALLP